MKKYLPCNQVARVPSRQGSQISTCKEACSSIAYVKTTSSLAWLEDSQGSVGKDVHQCEGQNEGFGWVSWRPYVELMEEVG